MTASTLTQQLELQVTLVQEATRGLTEDQWCWRPGPQSWSIVEVVGHLLDEETDDFRPRIRAIFADEAAWPPLDPERSVRDRKHQDRAPGDLLGQLREERAQSVHWLRGLEGPDWNAAMDHASLGPLRAGDLLAAWVAHDLLHIGQILRIRLELTRRSAAPWSLRYAAP